MDAFKARIHACLERIFFLNLCSYHIHGATVSIGIWEAMNASRQLNIV